MHVQLEGLLVVGNLVLYEDHPLHSLVEVGRQFRLGRGAPVSDGHHAVVVLRHDDQLLFVAGAEVRQNGSVPQT